MLGDITACKQIYIACGYTDMRKSIDGLDALVQNHFEMDPFESALFLFCGRRCDRIKALLWEWKISMAEDRRGTSSHQSAAVPMVDGRSPGGAEEGYSTCENRENILIDKCRKALILLDF